MKKPQKKIEDWEKKFDEVFEKVYGATDKTLLLKWLKDCIHDLLIEEWKKWNNNTFNYLIPKERERIEEDVIEIIKRSEATFFVNKNYEEIPANEALYELKAEIIDKIGLYFQKIKSDDFWRQAKKNHEKHYKEPNAKLSKARTEDNRFMGFYKFPDQFCPKCEEKMTLEFVSTSGKNIEQTGLKRICQRCKYNDFIKSLDETQFIFSMD